MAIDRAQRPQVKLLEFDERFAVLKEFVHYDFAQPTRLPGDTLSIHSAQLDTLT